MSDGRKMRGAPPKPRPTARVASTAAYQVPRHGAPVDLHLDGNEGPIAPRNLLEEIGAAFDTLVNNYPAASGLQEQWAAHLKVEPQRLRVTAGADEALDRIVRTYVGPGRELLTTEPTFEMLARYCRLAGGRYSTVPWPDGPFPTDAMQARISPRTTLIVVVTPNNPTGAVATIDDIRRLSAAAPHAVVLVDLAYVEFADIDPVADVLALPNTIVTRTLSKAWGLAGLRVGCAVGAPELIAWLAPSGNPYPVSGVSLALASAALRAGQQTLDESIAEVRSEREKLETTLRGLGADPIPSQANFVLARFRNAEWTWQALAGLGIAVRRFPGRPGLDTALRIACPGNASSFARLRAALGAALRPEALLFDLDGVLADVSGSFRRAVRATAARYGVEVSLDDITRAKAAGGANNDWDLTQRLMAERGVERSIDEVTAAFERIYQGDDGNRGLRETERCTVERGWLDTLATRVPLAVVTGRPRADAERFLRDAGILGLFNIVVTMHDAPSKPDPAPVRLALERLGVESAWMVGDTPDDIRAARGAGVVPVGIVAPGEDDAVMQPALVSAGAARVIRSLAELEELLP